MTKHEQLLSKIESALFESKVKKGDVADKLDITPTTFSLQLKNLKKGKNIPLKTIFAIEDVTGIKIFNI